MASMNNWLGFSLSPQQTQEQLSNGDVSDECFDLTSDSTTLPSLNLTAPFGVFEAFNRNNQSQDWNKTCSEMLIMDSSSNGGNQEPKLENFLGVCEQTYNTTNQEGCNSTIGLSMIKNWLRNNPTSSQSENKNDSDSIVEATGNISSSQTLSLSMSTGSKPNSDSPLLNGCASDNGGVNGNAAENKASLDSQRGAIEVVAPRKSIDTFGQRTSIYRGVTRHRWTGRYEAHLWDNSCRREGQTRKGRQVYLGGYDKEEKAARTYDLAALKYWGTSTTTNFNMSDYEKEIEEMKNMTRQEFVASLRRKSSGFSRGASIYRGVTRHHQHGRWQARIGRVAGNKDLYLGTFSTQEEAAEAYDIAAIKFRGLNAVTNFEISRYDVKSILESATLPIGGAARRLKEAEQAELPLDSSNFTADGSSNSYAAWPTIAFQQAQPLSMRFAYGQPQPRFWCKQERDADVTNTIQDFHQHQFGNAHNFLQPSVLHNLMNLDSSAMEQSSVSNSVYGNGTDTFNGSVYGNSSGYMVPMGTGFSQDQVVATQNQVNGYENLFGQSTDSSYQTVKNLYYHHTQQSPNGQVKSGVYDQSSSCNTWIPTAVPTTLEARIGSNMGVYNGAQTFTVWNDT